LRIFFSILLSTTLLLSLFSNEIVYITFKINQKEIAKKLCILREQKNNTCKGNCVLRAELKKLNENEKKHATFLKGKAEIVYVTPTAEYTLSQITYTKNTKNTTYSHSEKPIAVAFPFFHPPAV
jgi:hypothetical protein